MQLALQNIQGHQEQGGGNQHGQNHSGCGSKGKGWPTLTAYCWTHNWCNHTVHQCNTNSEGHNKQSTLTNIMGGRNQNWSTWYFGLVHSKDISIILDKIASITPKNIYSSTLDPHQHTIIDKADIVTIIHYWRQQDANILHQFKTTHHGLTIWLPNNSKISVTWSGLIPIHAAISPKSATSDVFNVLHSSYLISLVQFWDDDCVAILKRIKSILSRTIKQSWKKILIIKRVSGIYPYQGLFATMHMPSLQSTRQKQNLSNIYMVDMPHIWYIRDVLYVVSHATG